MPHITFIHGIKNKPPADELLQSWVGYLGNHEGVDWDSLGVSYSMVYWADVLYSEPATEGGVRWPSSKNAVSELTLDIAKLGDRNWRQNLSADEKRFVERLASHLLPSQKKSLLAAPKHFDAMANELLEQFQPVIEVLMELLLRDVHHYLFNAEHSPRWGKTYRVQDEIRRRFVETLKADAANNEKGPHLVVSHSMGTVIAYDCLKRVADCPEIDGLVTLGSPLGLAEIQEQLKPGYSEEDGYPREKVLGRWGNFYDKLDIVCGFDPILADDYLRQNQKAVEDVEQKADGLWRHDVAKYLGGPKLRSTLRDMLHAANV